MDNTDTWSKGLRQLVKDWAERVVVLQNEDGSLVSGIAWRKGYVVTADEAVGDHVKIVAAGGQGIAAELAGRDPSTDIALLRTSIRTRSKQRLRSNLEISRLPSGAAPPPNL